MEWKGKWSDYSEEVEEYAHLLKKYNDTIENEEDKFEAGIEDGTFLMCYSNWRDIYNNVFVCVDFPEEWCGVRYKYEWNEKNCGGTPSPMTEETARRWAKNP